MPILESTPYRVYYLIDLNRDKFRGIGPRDRSDERITIYARFDRENQFESVKLVVVTDFEDDYCNNNSRYEEFAWNDVDEEIVGLVGSYYLDHGEEYRRIMRYADMIQAMYENPKNVSFACDNEGRPRVSIEGLPYVRDNEVLDLSVTLSTLSDSYYNICINDHDPNYRSQSSCFTNNQLREIMVKAEKYDQLQDLVKGLLDNPANGIRAMESMMYTLYNPRW